MKTYIVDLIMSDQMHINADSVEEAKQKAIDKFGSTYYIDDVKVTELYEDTYEDLLNKIDKLNHEREIAELNLLHKMEDTLVELEYKIISSGMLKDWKQLQTACNKIAIRLCPYTSYDEEPKFKVLMSECNFFKDNGLCGDEYYLFGYSNEKIRWIEGDKPMFMDKKSELKRKIAILNEFSDLYVRYKKIQLDRIARKMERIEMETRKMYEDTDKGGVII